MKKPRPFARPWLAAAGVAAVMASIAHSGPTFSEPENAAQAKLIGKMSLQEAERMERHQADLAAFAPDQEKLDAGDFSPIEKAQAAQDVRRLWFIFDLARDGVRTFGADAIFKKYPLEDARRVPAMQEFNGRISERARQALASIPGHAVLWGDEVERLSTDPTSAQQRSSALRRLGELGSMEALQQIARFITDLRNPAAATPDHGPLLPPGRMGRPNFFAACQALQEGLGGKSPLRDDNGRVKRRELMEGDDFECL